VLTVFTAEFLTLEDLNLMFLTAVFAPPKLRRLLPPRTPVDLSA